MPTRAAPVKAWHPDGRGPGQRTAIAFGFVAALLPAVGGCAGPAEHPDVRAVLDQQIDAWNRADLEGFMAHYWRSDELVFRSPKGETHGWQATLDRFRRAYPTPEKMGSLSFHLGKIVKTGEDTAEVAGQYRVETAEGNQSGRFYLHLRRIDGAWVIVRDFTVQN